MFLLLYDQNRVGAGTAHGFCAFDYINKKKLESKTTLSPAGNNFLTA